MCKDLGVGPRSKRLLISWLQSPSAVILEPKKIKSDTPAACSFPGENARSWEALGEARPGQSSLSAG